MLLCIASVILALCNLDIYIDTAISNFKNEKNKRIMLINVRLFLDYRLLTTLFI